MPGNNTVLRNGGDRLPYGYEGAGGRHRAVIGLYFSGDGGHERPHILGLSLDEGREHHRAQAQLFRCALCGRSVEEIQADRIRCAEEYALAHQVTLVLKGADTLIISPEGLRCVNKTGNPSLAKAGSGDLLTGMIAALAARGLTPMEAACCGVWLHGKAADKSD